jgi:hypothetical protein
VQHLWNSSQQKPFTSEAVVWIILMNKRTMPKKAEKEPKKSEEPEGTSLCVAPEVVSVKRERELCDNGCIHDAYKKGLCHRCYKLSQGFVFDETKKLYVKKKEK